MRTLRSLLFPIGIVATLAVAFAYADGFTPGGTGTVGSVAAGPGIGVGSSGTTRTVSIDPTYTQRRVTGTCAGGIKTVAQDGSVTCNSLSDDGTNVTMTEPVIFTEPTNPSKLFSLLSAAEPSTATWALVQEEHNFGTYLDHTIEYGFNYIPSNRVDATKPATWMQGESKYDPGDALFQTEWQFSDRGTDDVEHRWISHTSKWNGSASELTTSSTIFTITDHSNTQIATFTTGGEMVAHAGAPTPDSLLHVWGGTAGVVSAVPATLLTLENAGAAYLQFLTTTGVPAGIYVGEGTNNDVSHFTFNSDVAGSWNLSSTAVGGDFGLQIGNTATTNANSNANLTLAVGGGATGDPYVHYLISGVQEWSEGIDNSVSDQFVISNGARPGTSDKLRITTGGTFTMVGGSDVFTGDTAGTFELLNVASSSTVPSIVPVKSDTTTGIGAQAAGNVSLIAGGVEVARVTSTGISAKLAANKGAITLSAGTGTATVMSGAVCACSDSTANASVKCAVATTTLTATGTASDVITYVCL